MSSGEQALSRLLEGNGRFAAGASLHPRQDVARRAQLAQQQAPFAVVLGCSDSRVPPELIFDQGLGDLFVVRVAGNIVEPGGLASFEYGVATLGCTLVVVLGHNGCGAVSAAVEAVANGRSFAGNLPVLVDAIKPAVLPAQGSLPEAVRRNVARVVERVKVAPLLQAVHVVGGVYDPGTGVVTVTTS